MELAIAQHRHFLANILAYKKNTVRKDLIIDKHRGMELAIAAKNRSLNFTFQSNYFRHRVHDS